ncbi:hypothetical protein ACFXHA_43935 [Nocardia sp. NPDC059240]|uniref:hypothetical protein n=1 Tax=Nocardia sp. NPDC059240 TaxID=3346786 RepID=UPI00369BF65A
MTTEDSIAAEPETVTVVAGRRRWWPWLSGLIVVALAVAAVTGWLISRSETKSPSARDELQSAQVALINAPGVHYTGRLTGTGGKSAGLDLRVTNVGDVSGTVDIGGGNLLNFLSIDGKTFLRGTRAAWLAYGFDQDEATYADGEQILEPASFYDLRLADALRPVTLGRRLDPNADKRIPVTLGAATTLGGHRSQGIVSDTVTTYVSSGRPERIVDPNFDVLLDMMSVDEVARFYSDLRPTVTALDDASNTETKVTTEGGWSNPCGPSCTAVSTLTSSPQPFLAITIPGYTAPVDDIFVSYQTTITVNGDATQRPDCSGVVQMPGNGTTTLSCAFTAGPGSHVGSTLTVRPVLGRARADALVATLDTDAKHSRDKANCVIESLHGEPSGTGC